MRWLPPIACLALALGVPWAIAQPASQPSDTAKLIAQVKQVEERSIEIGWQGLKPLPPRPIGQIFRFSTANNRLQLNWTFVGDGNRSLISVAGMPGQGVIADSVSPTSRGKPFMFNYWDFTDPNLVATHFQIISEPSALQVVHDIEHLDYSQSISLFQPVDGQLVLRVQTMPMQGNTPISNIVLYAPTFAALRQQHPREFDEYVRPMFRELHQESAIFEADDRVAWQVLGDTWSPPPGLAEQVNALVAQMNADEYSTRAAAEKQLRAMGEPAALYLMTIDRHALSPEQLERVDEVLGPYRPLNQATVAAFRKSPSFLLDCLSSDDLALRTAALAHLDRAVGHAVQFDVNQPREQRLDAIDALRSKLAPRSTTAP